MHPSSLFSLSDHLARLSNDGDPLEVLDGTVDFERFRDLLVDALGYSNGAKGGRPPFDPVSMFKVLVVQISSAGQGRACLRASERTIWSVHSHHRSCACRGQAHTRQPRLQF